MKPNIMDSKVDMEASEIPMSAPIMSFAHSESSQVTNSNHAHPFSSSSLPLPPLSSPCLTSHTLPSVDEEDPADCLLDSEVPSPSSTMSKMNCQQCSSCPGFSEHGTWRKVCQHCRCPAEAHRISVGDISQLVRDFQRQCGSSSDNDSGCALEDYTWIPSGLSSEQVHQYFSHLPESRVPLVNSEGEQSRLRQLLWQLPPHDSSVEYCRELTNEERDAHRVYNEMKKAALGRASVKVLPLTLPAQSDAACNKCKASVLGGEMVVTVSQPCPPEASSWHPECFRCSVCEDHLVDLIYFYKEGEVLCGRHYAETTKPRCDACDELIFSEECTEAEDRCWHVDHFCCFECSAPLGGQRYVMRTDRPFCTACYEQLYAQHCAACSKPIQVDQGQMTHDGLHWHATDECFCCSTCRRPLLGGPFLPKGGRTFCSEQCSTNSDGCSANVILTATPEEIATVEGHTQSFSAAHFKSQASRLSRDFTPEPRSQNRLMNLPAENGFNNNSVRSEISPSDHVYHEIIPAYDQTSLTTPLLKQSTEESLSSGSNLTTPTTTPQHINQHVVSANVTIHQTQSSQMNSMSHSLPTAIDPSYHSLSSVSSSGSGSPRMGVSATAAAAARRRAPLRKQSSLPSHRLPNSPSLPSTVPVDDLIASSSDDEGDYSEDDQVPPLPLSAGNGDQCRSSGRRGMVSSKSFGGHNSSLIAPESMQWQQQRHIDMVNNRYQRRMVGSPMDPITRPTHSSRPYAMVTSQSAPHGFNSATARASMNGKGRRRPRRRSSRQRSTPSLAIEQADEQHRTRARPAMSRSYTTAELSRSCSDPHGDDRCSTCSSSSGSESEWEDEAYAEEVRRSRGMRISYVDGEMVVPKECRSTRGATRAVVRGKPGKHQKKGNCSVM